VAEKGGDLPGFADLELIRTEAGIAVTRFCSLLGIPRATWYRWKSAVRRPGRWPAPVVDPLEPLAATYAATFAAWGHRKLWALLQADGHHVSMSSVARALSRRGLLLPQRYQAERRQLARARRAVFIDPPTRRCRVWQFDFSEFETTSGGIWRLGGVVDYVAKVSLACPTTTTQTAVDAIAAVEAARVQAETWLGYSLLEECLDLVTGELLPLAIVTDNGSAFRSAAFARYIASRPEFTHIRTRHRSPQTNGVVECCPSLHLTKHITPSRGWLISCRRTSGPFCPTEHRVAQFVRMFHLPHPRLAQTMRGDVHVAVAQPSPPPRAGDGHLSHEFQRDHLLALVNVAPHQDDAPVGDDHSPLTRTQEIIGPIDQQ
jgi:putative transposase